MLVRFPLRHLICLLLGVATVGCQSEKEGVEIICKGISESKLATVEPALRQRALSEYLSESVSNDDARALLRDMAEMGPRERALRLTREAERLGIARCRMAIDSEIAEHMETVRETLTDFLEAFRQEFEAEPDVASVLDHSCSGIDSWYVSTDRGRDAAISQLERIHGEIEACFAALAQRTTNLDVPDQYMKLEPATALHTASRAYTAAVAAANTL